MANIIGISAHFHDAACCLLRDGGLIAAAEEERFSRLKHDASLPKAAFAYCLAAGQLSIEDVDCVAYYEEPAKKLARQIYMLLPGLPREHELLARFDPHRPERDIREGLGYEGRIEFVGHHLSHAASAFFFSGFEESAILTVDGVGEWDTTTYATGRGAVIETLESVEYPDSLGLLYSTLTNYLGFEVNEGEYKVMGLAPYGRPRYADRVRQLVASLPGGQFRLDLRYFDFVSQKRMFTDELAALFDHEPRTPGAPIESFHEDVARSLQVVLEEILLDKVRYLHARTGSDHLCMAGGVALNCVANGRIVREGPFKRLFVQPAAGDAGGCLGAAAVASRRLPDACPPPSAMRHAYWGPAYSSAAIARVIGATALPARDYTGRESELLADAADRLARGQTMGWFHGRMEFGPRALGARSILAAPTDAGMRDRINALIKQREEFRPFAPAVLVERCRDHFDLDHVSPFMLETCRVTSPLSLGAITHVDASARVQTVDRAVSPRFAALLDAFERRTGCPILLNTSFNMKDEPIVCSPVDALICFMRAGLDVLVLEDMLIERSALGPVTQIFRDVRRAKAPAITHRTYTLL